MDLPSSKTLTHWTLPAICALLTACGDAPTTTEAERFEVLNPIVQDATREREFVAEVQSIRYVEVRSRIGGYVERIYVDEGQLVEEGQLLFDVSSKESEIELQKAAAALKVAQAELKAAEVELENVWGLVSKNISSQAEFDMLKAKVDALKARVEEATSHRDQAALNLGFSRIKAPYKGRINRVPYKVGSVVKPEDVLTTISDNNEMFAYFHLSELEFFNLRPELNDSSMRRVTLLLPNGEAYTHPGYIEIAESEFDQGTGNIALRARFPNPERTLRHGSNAKVVLRRTASKALLVPQRSTFEVQDKLYVLVVKADSTVEQRNISTAFRLPDLYVVANGLAPEERIVFEGVQRLRQGDRITPQQIAPEAALAKLNIN